MNHAEHFENPLPATDAIIIYSDGKKEGIVLIERKNEPYGLALPGGFAEKWISYEDNVIKEVKEETNLDFILESPEHPLCVHSHPRRDPRTHITSTFYVGRGYGTLRAGDDARDAKLYTIDEVITLIEQKAFAFRSHERALQDYLTREGYLPGGAP